MAITIHIPTYVQTLAKYHSDIEVSAGGFNYEDIVWEKGTPLPKEEMDAHRLEYAIETCVNEYIDKHLQTKLANGITSTALGEEYRYDSNMEGTINLMGMVLAGQDNYFACTNVATGIRDYHLHTPLQFQQVMSDGASQNLSRYSVAHGYRQTIRNATDLETIRATTEAYLKS